MFASSQKVLELTSQREIKDTSRKVAQGVMRSGDGYQAWVQRADLTFALYKKPIRDRRFPIKTGNDLRAVTCQTDIIPLNLRNEELQDPKVDKAYIQTLQSQAYSEAQIRTEKKAAGNSLAVSLSMIAIAFAAMVCVVTGMALWQAR